MIAAHVRGYKPQSVYKFMDETPLTEKEMSFVETLERAQKYVLNRVLSSSYQYETKKLALLALSGYHAGNPFNYEVQI